MLRARGAHTHVSAVQDASERFIEHKHILLIPFRLDRVPGRQEPIQHWLHFPFDQIIVLTQFLLVSRRCSSGRRAWEYTGVSSWEMSRETSPHRALRATQLPPGARGMLKALYVGRWTL